MAPINTKQPRAAAPKQLSTAPTRPTTKPASAAPAARTTKAPQAPGAELSKLISNKDAKAADAEKWLRTSYGPPEMLNQATTQKALTDINEALKKIGPSTSAPFQSSLLDLRASLERGASVSDAGKQLLGLASLADQGKAGPEHLTNWLEASYGRIETLDNGASAAAAQDLAALFDGPANSGRADNNPAFFGAALNLKNTLERQAEMGSPSPNKWLPGDAP